MEMEAESARSKSTRRSSPSSKGVVLVGHVGAPVEDGALDPANVGRPGGTQSVAVRPAFMIASIYLGSLRGVGEIHLIAHF